MHQKLTSKQKKYIAFVVVCNNTHSSTNYVLFKIELKWKSIMYSPNNLQSNFRKVGGGCYKTQVGNDKYIILQWKQFLFLKGGGSWCLRQCSLCLKQSAQVL